MYVCNWWSIELQSVCDYSAAHLYGHVCNESEIGVSLIPEVGQVGLAMWEI